MKKLFLLACVLACAVNGQQLKSMPIFKWNTSPQGNFTIESQKSGTHLANVHGGLPKKIQNLELVINPSFKTHVRKYWEKWMPNSLYSFTKKVINMKMATYKEVTSLERCGIITPLIGKNFDVYNNDAE